MYASCMLEWCGGEGRIITISGNYSEKLKIAGGIESDQCFYSTQKGPNNSPVPLNQLSRPEIHFCGFPRAVMSL
jgi:hypothetical protein